MTRYTYVKVGNRYHRVIEQTERWIECDGDGITEEEMLDLNIRMSLRDNPIAAQLYEENKKLKAENLCLKRDLDSARTSARNNQG